MCGIAGIFHKSNTGDCRNIKAMNDAISHRGPDGEGYIAVQTGSGNIYQLAGEQTPVSAIPIEKFSENTDLHLAHRRLSIIDLSPAGHQPMANNRQDIWITYNGEIYNYLSLKSELEGRGYTFSSHTDTEVLLYAYEEWGTDCLHRFNGMWSFVIYDKRRNILFGSRDRFGVKPLYYVRDAGFFAFCSEIKGLMATGMVSRKANTKAAASYLKQGLENFAGDTFFDSVSELLPAHSFVYDLKTFKFETSKYYNLKTNNIWESYDEKKCRDHISHVREKVLNAVDLRLHADVAVGSCLSGGMDSSAIVCSIEKLLTNRKYDSVGKRQGVVTACYDNFHLDESSWAKIVVDSTGADWHKTYPLREELLSDLSDLVYSQDVPFGSTSIYAQYRVMKSAKEAGLTVMLDGQGGDELFTGYTPYYKMFYEELLFNGEYDLISNEQKYIGNTPFKDYDIMESIKPRKKKSTIRRMVPKPIKDVIFYCLKKNKENYISAKSGVYPSIRYDSLNGMLAALMTNSSLPQLLKYEDRNSMRFSVESRTPFADDVDLIEYVFNIPASYKIHNGWSKFLLRESMKGIVPDKIRKRTDKIGFNTPEYEWLAKIKPLVFASKHSELESIIKMNKLESNWDSIMQLQNKSGVTEIWRYINYILWFDAYHVCL